MTSGQLFNLTSEQVDYLSRQASGGSADAAYRLSMYYDMVTGDREMAEIYLRRAAELKEPRAEVAIGLRLSTSASAAEREQGKKFLAEAKTQGLTPESGLPSLPQNDD